MYAEKYVRAYGAHALERARSSLCAYTCFENADNLDGWMDGPGQSTVVRGWSQGAKQPRVCASEGKDSRALAVSRDSEFMQVRSWRNDRLRFGTQPREQRVNGV